MIDLSEMADPIDHAYAEGAPCMVGTASADGRPNIAFKGSLMVFDSEHLAFWERARGDTIANLAENPHAVVVYRNPKRDLAYRIYGKAELYHDGELRQRIMERTIPEELEKDPERTGIAVLIRVDRVIARGRTPVQER